MNNSVQERLDKFKVDLIELPLIQVVRKHIISGDCFILPHDLYFDLRSEVADHFGLHPNEVFVVGSAKLGFSVVPKKRFRPFRRNKSDIDIALVSSKLFDQVSEDIFIYKQETGDWPEYDEFADYFFQGRIRPDMFPRSPVFPFGKKWWDFFLRLTGSRRYGDYSISGALYKSFFFIENYQKDCVQQCKDYIQMSNLEVHNENNSNK